MNTETIWRPDIQQRVFREVVESFSRPGRVQDLAGFIETANAQTAALATLMDGETTLADPHGQIAPADWPLLQARQSATEIARYIAVDGQRAPDFQPSLGTLASPELGATLLIKVSALGSGPLHLTLSGPGIAGQSELRVAGLHGDWLQQRAHWVAGFPLGVDIILCTPSQIAALPRTTQVSMTSLAKGAA